MDGDKVTVHQLQEPCQTYLEVEIIECPDQFPIAPSTTFGVKALVKNVSDEEICDVGSWIKIEGVCIAPCPLGSASVISGTPPMVPYNLGCIPPGCEEEVGWTLHCDGPGLVKITVDANGKKSGWDRLRHMCGSVLRTLRGQRGKRGLLHGAPDYAGTMFC
jgi:hypothetical protein